MENYEVIKTFRRDFYALKYPSARCVLRNYEDVRKWVLNWCLARSYGAEYVRVFFDYAMALVDTVFYERSIMRLLRDNEE